MINCDANYMLAGCFPVILGFFVKRYKSLENNWSIGGVNSQLIGSCSRTSTGHSSCVS